MADGETAVSKSKRKKLIKLQKAQGKKHKAYLENPELYNATIEAGKKAKLEAQTKTSAAGDGSQEEEADMPNSEHLTFIQGTFGNRQGLRVDASCGPFTHAFAFGGGE